MNLIKTEAIILSAKYFLEKDKLLTIFSPILGKCKVLARGSKMAGRLEATNHVQLILYKGKSFLGINQCDLVAAFPNIRTDFNKISLIFYFFDIVQKATVFDQNNTPLFELLLSMLAQVDLASDLNAVRALFQNRFLQIEGLLKSPLSDTEFRIRFQEYSGKLLAEPAFI